MFRKALFAAALIAAPLALTETASADHNCYRSYRAPVVTYRNYGGHYGQRYHAPRYRSGYIGINSGYYSPYRSYYGRGYGGYGYGGYGYGSPFYYGRGTSIGIGRGGFGLSIGF